LESDFLRLLIANPEGAGALTVELFEEPDLRMAAEVVVAARGPAGTEVDVAALDVEPAISSVILSHAVGDRGLAVPELLTKAESLMIDAEIDRLEAVVAATDPGDEGYSRAFNRLIALQQEKRRL
jgi:hypothetical protein